MTTFENDDVVLVGLVSLLSCYQLAMFAQAVGDLRRKHKVVPPEMNGPAEIIRGFRAQQNSLEYCGIFLTTLWLSGIYFHQIPAALVGLEYVYSRKLYFEGYVRDANDRLPGFKMGVTCLKMLLGMGITGLSTCFLRRYLGIDLWSFIGM